jgi:hypothetical protein
VLNLPEGAQSIPIAESNSISLNFGTHRYIFQRNTDKWIDIDTKAILESDDNKAAGQPKN